MADAALRQPSDVSITFRSGTDPWAAFPDAPPASKASAPAQADPWADFPDTAPPAKQPSREIGTGEAALTGAVHGLTFGAAPAIEGASAAANPDIEAAAQKFGIDPDTAKSFLDHVAPALKEMYGAGRIAVDAATGNGQPSPAQQAYSKARQEAADTEEEASSQHPYIYTGSELAGSLLAPVPGASVAKGATTLARVGRGIAQGATAGGLFGAGEAVGQGKSVPEILEQGAKGAAIGGAVGGPLGAITGRAAAGPGSKAAQTAEDLGAPLPRGVASDNPLVRSATAKLKEVPFAGEKIGERVGATETAAGEKIGDISNELGGADRATVDASLRPALQHVIEGNNQQIDNAYGALRKEINPDQHFPMPRLQQAIKEIELRRSRAGWQKPSEGLQQAKNVANGTGHAGGFNGVHRLRRDLREAGSPLKANPGYDKGDFRYLKKAVDADLKAGVRHVSTNPNTAESLFNTAELEAGKHIKANEVLDRLIGSKGEGAVSTLLNAAKEKGGNLALLRELKATMPKDAFDQVAGVLLHELGFAAGVSGKFSLKQFETNWAKISDGAKNTMFSPQHREWIENITGLARHVKDADRYANTSHTGAFVAVLELAETARELITHGGMNMATAGILASSGGTYLLTRWLASPAKAASLSRWTTAYRALTLNQPTPARIAAFRVATRNLANNIDLPFDRVMSIADSHLASPAVNASEQPNAKENGKPRVGISQ